MTFHEIWNVEFVFYDAVGVMGVSFFQGGQRIHDGNTGISHEELLHGTKHTSSIGETILNYTAFIGKTYVRRFCGSFS